MWKLALLGEACPIDPSLHGWSIVDGQYAIKWFNGDQVPQALWSLLENTNDTGCQEVDDNTVYGKYIPVFLFR